ncbi:MAG TPA: ABC transporter permease subunit [Ktedonobacterales bacterium]|nr:ABC transporter permease subunit [Ktedonobacterales bacterium]
MSVLRVATTASGARTAPGVSRELRASFTGLLWGELFKITRMRIAWVLASVYILLVIGGQLILVTGPNTQSQLRNDPLGAFHTAIEGDFAIVRIFCGIIVLVLAAQVVGMEYQQGTIRILLGRGVGRLQLLGAKALALTLTGLALLAAGLLIELAFTVGMALALAGAQHPWTALNGEFWADMWYSLLCAVISMGATLLLGIAASVVGRSLAFGLAVGLCWFPVDNLLTLPLSILSQITHADFWLKVSGLLLGPMLNRLPDYLAPPWHSTVPGPHGAVTIAQGVSGFGIQPLIPVDGGHALLVITAYSLIFAVTAIVLTKRRDVLE